MRLVANLAGIAFALFGAHVLLVYFVAGTLQGCSGSTPEQCSCYRSQLRLNTAMYAMFLGDDAAFRQAIRPCF